MRKNFVEILKNNKVDIKREYSRLYSLLHSNVNVWVEMSRRTTTVYDLLDGKFYKFWFRGTALSLANFDREKGFNFVEKPESVSIEELVLFCEYCFNLFITYRQTKFNQQEFNVDFCIEQIAKIIEEIGYEQEQDKTGLTFFVEKSPAATSVAEILPEKVSYKVFSYNHHSMRGNIQGKKEILIELAGLLEPQRKQLKEANSCLEDELFYAFNNLNIRHNNMDKKDKKRYRKAVAEMKDEEIESWYDEVYQMSLLAFLELEQMERKVVFCKLKERIERN